MRSFFRDHWKVIVAIVLLVVLAMFTVNPGGAAPAPSPASVLAARLRTHVAALAPASAAGPRQLEQAARYIEATLRGEGYAIQRRVGQGGQGVRNIEAALANLAPGARPERVFIVGAHAGAPAADAGQAGGAAAVLELARLLRAVRPSRGTEIRFVFLFGPAAGQTPSAPGDARNFIAFAGPVESSRLVQGALAAFQGNTGAPARGLAALGYVQGVTLSGPAAGARPGYPAIMVTGTAFGRYPYFEATNEPAADTPEPVDYAGLARVLSGLARTIEALAAGRQG